MEGHGLVPRRDDTRPEVALGLRPGGASVGPDVLVAARAAGGGRPWQ
jgi:hypothetical protein